MSAVERGLVALLLRASGSGEQEQRHQRHSERGGVDRKRPAGADDRDERAADRGTGEPACDRPDELVERVRRREVSVGQQRRHHRLEGGREERRADPVDGDERRRAPRAAARA